MTNLDTAPKPLSFGEALHAIRVGRDFERSMRDVETLVGTSREQMKGLARSIASVPYPVTGSDGVTRLRKPDLGGW